ncbi:MAG: hypothetical protein GY754_43450 [bacterium]|nr:hypothetical protein [bacterium]
MKIIIIDKETLCVRGEACLSPTHNTAQEKKLVDDRLEAHYRNPEAGSSWKEVYDRIVGKFKNADPAGPGNNTEETVFKK